MSDKFCELYYPFTRGFNDAPLYENAAEWRRASVVLFDPSLPFLMTCSTQALWSSVNPVHPHKHETTPSSPLLKDQSVIIIGATPRKEWKRKMYNCILDGRSVVRELMSLGDGIKLRVIDCFKWCALCLLLLNTRVVFRHVRQSQCFLPAPSWKGSQFSKISKSLLFP